MKNLFKVIAFSTCLGACGDTGIPLVDGSSSSDSSTQIGPDYTTSYEGPTLGFSGYVASAFSLSVDGVDYFDMEDFYTTELANLPDKVAAAGYEGYEVQFDAQIGLSDLWHNMAVYVAPEQDTGYQGSAYVEQSGQFTVDLPVEADGSFYKVRANKRINVILRRDSEVLTFCYNFSAIEKSVLLSSTEHPIILDNFTTHLTSYECAPASTGEMSLPSQNGSSPALLSKGMSKSQVLEILGSDGLVMEGDSQWCWVSNGFSQNNNCAVNYASSCQCSVTFSDGLVSDQDNIVSSKIDVVNW